MNQYETAVGKVSQSWEKADPRKKPAEREHQAYGKDGGTQDQDDDATVKMAELLSQEVLHRQLSRDEKKKAGPVVHYVYGALAGGLYGLAAGGGPSGDKRGKAPSMQRHCLLAGTRLQSRRSGWRSLRLTIPFHLMQMRWHRTWSMV